MSYHNRSNNNISIPITAEIPIMLSPCSRENRKYLDFSPHSREITVLIVIK